MHLFHSHHWAGVDLAKVFNLTFEQISNFFSSVFFQNFGRSSNQRIFAELSRFYRNRIQKDVTFFLSQLGPDWVRTGNGQRHGRAVVTLGGQWNTEAEEQPRYAFKWICVQYIHIKPKTCSTFYEGLMIVVVVFDWLRLIFIFVILSGSPTHLLLEEQVGWGTWLMQEMLFMAVKNSKASHPPTVASSKAVTANCMSVSTAIWWQWTGVGCCS